MKDKNIKKWDLLTPSQIMEKYPKLQRIYTCQQMGYLLYSEGVDGKRLKRGCLISESDFLRFAKERLGFTPD